MQATAPSVRRDRPPRRALAAAWGTAPAAGARGSGGQAFAAAAVRYWAHVFPVTCGEIAGWRAQAGTIGDPELRVAALTALGKRSNLEGAAAFAAFAPTARRAEVVRASVAFQAAYDYLDVLCERAGEDALAQAPTLNEALPVAFELGLWIDGRTAARSFYAEHDDSGYLAALLEACRGALGRLPGLTAAASGLQRAAERAAGFQALNVPVAANGARSPLAAWAARLLPGDSGLAWWEAAAAAGSSLGVHALIAAAAGEDLGPEHAAATERAYFPAIGALHSLLDQLVDRDEDARAGQPNISWCYRDPAETATGLRRIAAAARRSAQRLDAQRPGGHMLLLSAMAANYLAAPEAGSAAAAPARAAVLQELGPLARTSITVFKGRRLGRHR